MSREVDSADRAVAIKSGVISEGPIQNPLLRTIYKAALQRTKGREAGVVVVANENGARLLLKASGGVVEAVWLGPRTDPDRNIGLLETGYVTLTTTDNGGLCIEDQSNFLLPTDDAMEGRAFRDFDTSGGVNYQPRGHANSLPSEKASWLGMKQIVGMAKAGKIDHELTYAAVQASQQVFVLHLPSGE